MAVVANSLLEVIKIKKFFAGNIALNEVDFDVKKGEIHALLGENGAGKSTLIKILSGVYTCDGGEIRLNGHRVNPNSSFPLPISFIHQDLGLVDTMTVAENVAMVSGYQKRWGLISWKQVNSVAAKVLSKMGGNIDPDETVGSLTAAEKAIVAIARSLAVSCELLVLDEPTAALPESDVNQLLGILKQLRDEGIGIIYVSHRIDEIFRIADRVTVLRDGKKISTVPISQTTPTDLVSKIVGRPIKEVFITAPSPTNEVAFAMMDAVTESTEPVSITVRKGEVVGLVGLRGAGQEKIGRLIYGDVPVLRGTFEIDGHPYKPSSPARAISKGIGLVSGKRSEESLAGNLTVRENLYINLTFITGGRGLINRRREVRLADMAIHKFSVRPNDGEKVVSTLSGGNQQKVVLARWFSQDIKLLILEEPTIGVDVGSKSEIYRFLTDELGKGVGILLISSDFEEVSGICHRAIVFNRGKIVGEVSKEQLSVQYLTELASGSRFQI